MSGVPAGPGGVCPLCGQAVRRPPGGRARAVDERVHAVIEVGDSPVRTVLRAGVLHAVLADFCRAAGVHPSSAFAFVRDVPGTGPLSRLAPGRAYRLVDAATAHALWVVHGLPAGAAVADAVRDAGAAGAAAPGRAPARSG